MFDVVLARFRQGYRTMSYPAGDPPPMPDRFVGRPELGTGGCPADCFRCADACAVGAVEPRAGQVRLDLGRCLFCRQCETACPNGQIRFTTDHRLAARNRQDLVLEGPSAPGDLLSAEIRRLFGRSLRLRQVSAGGCNACEADTNVLGTVGWDLGRFGIQFVASPRHADGLLITGPVPENMREALLKTWQAVASPKLVIAVGACAIAGGPYVDHVEVHNGADHIVPVDLYVPGCPPHPLSILEGLLGLLGQIGRNGPIPQPSTP